MENLDRLFRQVGKLGKIVELAFAHQGILCVHETATEWYRNYREMVDTIEELQDLLEDTYGAGDDEEQESERESSAATGCFGRGKFPGD